MYVENDVMCSEKTKDLGLDAFYETRQLLFGLDSMLKEIHSCLAGWLISRITDNWLEPEHARRSGEVGVFTTSLEKVIRIVG